MNELWVSNIGTLTSNFTTRLLSRTCITSKLKYFDSISDWGKLKTNDISDWCDCKLANFFTLHFNISDSISYAPFDLTHYDVCGPSPVFTKYGSRHYVFFTDDYNR